MTTLKLWRFGFDDEEVSLRDISWKDVVRIVQDTVQGTIHAQLGEKNAQYEYNATHATVLFMSQDGIIVRPYFPDRDADVQDTTKFICDGCGVKMGPQDEYLERFFDRETGFRLFEATLLEPSLPKFMPDMRPHQLMLDGLELVTSTPLEWQPMPYQE